MRATSRRAWLAGLCAGVLALGAGAAPAGAAAPEPDFTFFPAGLQGPCGVAVDSAGVFYLSNHYNNSVDVYSPPTTAPIQLLSRIWPVDPAGGPCGLAVAPSGAVYVNGYHRRVEKFVPSLFPPSSATTYASAGTIDSQSPTGVAIDPGTGTVYVDNRTHVSAYEPSGAPVLDGVGEPLRIGEGSLEDGYGLAVSGFPGTAGHLYVPDHASGTVKVYDPGAAEPDAPVLEIAGPPGGFGSLRDSAVAVDDASGDVYVVDTVAYPQYTESPLAVVRVFDQAGVHQGRLKYDVVDGSPTGLAVDNSGSSAQGSQGRVYVTTGNTVDGGLYAYPPGSATATGAPGLAPSAAGASGTAGGGPAGGARTASAAAPSSQTSSVSDSPPAPGARASAVTRGGRLQVKVSGGLVPRSLPRRGRVPVAVTLGGRISTTDGSDTPQLRFLRIEVNRHGRLSHAGLPTCRYGRIDPASTATALRACRPALVGQGDFTADIVLPGQDPYPTQGKLLLFNGKRKGRPVVLGHIYASRPFTTSFVIVFTVRKARRGTYGTVLAAKLPRALGSWGHITGIRMTLKRTFRHRGSRRSFLSAGCPAPRGFNRVLFPLARTSFRFAGGRTLRSVLVGTCRARGR